LRPTQCSQRVTEIVMDVGKIGLERNDLFVEADGRGEFSGAVTPEGGIAES